MNEKRQVDLGGPVVGERELERIREVFESGWLLNGPEVDRFEDEFADFVGAQHAVGVVNCTAGMDIAVTALGLENGRIAVPGQAFVANGIALLQNNATPLFVDVDPETYNIDPAELEAVADRVDGVLLLHYAGLPTDMDRILEIAEQHDLAVIEDAAHALGSTYDGQSVGTFGDVTVFSFGPLKMITTAMGGMVTTADDEVTDRIEMLRSYGMDADSWDRDRNQQSWQYSIPELGHNFRLPDTAAAMGRAQLQRVDEFVHHRQQRAAEYTDRLQAVDGIQPPVDDTSRTHSYLYYVIRVDDAYPLTRDELALRLEDNDVEVSVHWDPPLHEHTFIKQFADNESLPVSELLADRLLTLPMHPNLQPEDVEYVASLIESYAE